MCLSRRRSEIDVTEQDNLFNLHDAIKKMLLHKKSL